MTTARLALVSLLLVSLTACVNQTVKTSSVPPLERPAQAAPESALLDVGVLVFDPGLDDYDEDQQVYPEVRRPKRGSCRACWPRPCRTAGPGALCASSPPTDRQ